MVVKIYKYRRKSDRNNSYYKTSSYTYILVYIDDICVFDDMVGAYTKNYKELIKILQVKYKFDVYTLVNN